MPTGQTDATRNIPAKSTALPAAGTIFNFSKLLDSVLIPRVIARDRKLQPGARLLWGVIRQRSHRDGVCASSDADLAEELGVSERQLRRYCAALIREGLLISKQRPGLTPHRALLWNDRFNSTVVLGAKREI